LCDAHDVDVVGYESVMFMHTMSQQWNALYHAQVGIIEMVSWWENVACIDVPTGDVKMRAAGKGNATKAEIMVGVEAGLGCIVEGEHEADALSVAVQAACRWRTT